MSTVSSYGTSVSGSLTPVGRVGGFLAVSAYREVRDASNLGRELSGSSNHLSVIGTASLRATPTLSLDGSLTYLPGRNLPQGRISPLVFSTLGMRQQLWAGRGTLTLSVVDPFELEHFTFTTRDRSHVQIGKSTYSARRAALGVSYSFGRTVQRKSRGKKDEAQQKGSAPEIR